MIVTETKTTTFCDVRGVELVDTGWALVRRKDGQEVAHFGSLSHLTSPESAQKIFRAAWGAMAEESAE